MSSSASLDAAGNKHSRDTIIIDCSQTRYHVVRAAAHVAGWIVNDTDAAETVPEMFYGVSLSSDASSATAHPPQVIWTDKSVLSARVAGLQCYQRLNHFPAMHVIARKAILFRRLMQLSRLCLKMEADADCGAPGTSLSPSFPLYRYFVYAIPLSFSSLGDRGRLDAYQRQLSADASHNENNNTESGPFFIIKPNTGCEGRGIRLTTTPLDDLSEAEKTDKKRECIIQVYIDRPLLVDGKKFDLRLYVLLVAVTPAHSPRYQQRRFTDGAERESEEAENALRFASELNPSDASASQTEVPAGVDGVHLYVHREGLVRICAEPYTPPTTANCTNALQHLTNYAVNKKSDLFKPGHVHEAAHEKEKFDDNGHSTARQDSPKVVDDGNKRSLAALAAYIEGLHVPGGWARVQRRIDECIALTMLSGVETLRRELVSAGGARGDRADGRGCFELLGFDVMLRADSLEPVLMEVNHSPSLFCDTAFDFAVKSAVLRDTFHLLAAHLPPWGVCEGGAKKYAAYTSPGSRTAKEMERAELTLLTPAADTPCGFRQLLPHYSACSYAEPPSTAEKESQLDWQENERAAQELMVQLSKQLR